LYWRMTKKKLNELIGRVAYTTISAMTDSKQTEHSVTDWNANFLVNSGETAASKQNVIK